MHPLFHFFTRLSMGCVVTANACAVDVDATSAATTPWIDRHHANIERYVDKRAQTIDAWFKTDTQNMHGANAALTVYMDNGWDKYSNVTTKIRLRGRVHLPTMNQRFNLVFGDESLDDEKDSDVLTPNNRSKAGDLNSTREIEEDAREKNASFALRYAYKQLKDVGADVDLGLRSGSDVYVRGRLALKKPVNEHWNVHLEPMLRYGTKSRFYAQQSIDLKHRPLAPAQAQPWFDTFNIHTLFRYSELENASANPGVGWSQRYNLHRQLTTKKTLDYGIQANGYLNIDDSLHTTLHSYGIYTSYRQPVWREWLFVRGDVNYITDRERKRDWYPQALVRLEAHF